MATWEELVGLVRRLRGPGGCPWDHDQTHASLRRYALEEAREVAAAIDEGDMHALADELGDLLLQVLLHAVIAEEEGVFGPRDVLVALAGKLVRRHPHVFGSATASTPADVSRGWEERKRAERQRAVRPEQAGGLLADVGRSLPALAEAEGLGARAAEVGFDWGSASAAWEKVREECEEFRAAWAEAVPGARSGAVEEELGDLLFSLVNVARLLDVDAEGALSATNDKFRRRFAAVEAGARESGRDLASLGLDEMEGFWQGAKGPRKERDR